MPVKSFFATKLYEVALPDDAATRLNAELKHACLALAKEDRAGVRWSRENGYPGYTSYASLNDLTWRIPSFAALQKTLDAHAGRFARQLDFDLGGQALKLDSLWVNVLAPGGMHSGHIHPNSALSGTYYVSVPRGSGALKIEDPRLPLMMAAPPRKASARPDNRAFIYVDPRPGQVLLWESWLRHEVTAGTAKSARISVSFNYAWW